jgi:hypothetical protein
MNRALPVRKAFLAFQAGFSWLAELPDRNTVVLPQCHAFFFADRTIVGQSGLCFQGQSARNGG